MIKINQIIRVFYNRSSFNNFYIQESESQIIMQGEQFSIKQTYNLFLHKFLDNEQPKSVTLMKLDTHSTPYYNAVQNKYITNLVVAGRNFIQLYAVFQNQLTLYMGIWHLYEDILQVQQWQKTIVISTSNKIVGLIYEDYVLKNSFMLSLDCIQLGYRQYIQTICDKNGYYMVISTSRQILLCISQKAVHKYKAKPFSHRKMTIIQQNIKWNRPQYMSIVDVVKFQFYDFQLSKVQNFHFCDHSKSNSANSSNQNNQYAMGSNMMIQNSSAANSSNQKHLYQIPIQQIFSDNEKQSLIIKFIKLDDDAKQCYIIRRDNYSQFLQIKKNNNILLKHQKGEFIIQDNLFKSNTNQEDSKIICKKNNHPFLFPLQIFYKNTLYIYQRAPVPDFSIPAFFSKRTIKLPQNFQIQACDIQDNIFVYCNLYQVGLIPLKNLGNSMSLGKSSQMQCQNQDNLIMKSRIILKQSFGNIIDFNIGQNILLIQNTYKRKCSLRLLRRGIIQSPKSHITHPKKRALQEIDQVKNVRSLQKLLNQYEISQPQQQIIKIREFLRNYLVIQHKNGINNLFKLNGANYELIQGNLFYWGVVKNVGQFGQTQLQVNCWYFIIWTLQDSLLFFKIPIQSTQQNSLKLSYKLDKTQLQMPRTSLYQIYKIKQYIIVVFEQESNLLLYNWAANNLLRVNLPIQSKEKKQNIIRINWKSITFKKKDKDFLILQIIVIMDGEKMQIWEVSAESGLFKISHATQNLGQGLAILLKSQINFNPLNNQLRAITCPQYVLFDKNMTSQFFKSPTVLKMHVYQYQTQNFLFFVNSRQQLQVYKKIYCSNTQNNIIFGAVDTGYLYYRQSLQLNIIKKFKYNQATIFIDIGCGILRICNLVFFKGQFLQFPQNIRSCFKLQDEQIWCITNDNKIKQLISQGKIISHFLTTTIESQIKQQILGIQSTSQNYIIYSRNSFQVFDKQLKSTWKPSEHETNIRTQNKEFIMTICAYDHFVAVSYCNYCQDQSKNEYKSVKFKLRIYNIITKKKVIEKQNFFEQPVLHIRYVPPDKLIVVTSSNVSINTIKSQGLQNTRNKHYSKRGMLSSFSYLPEKTGNDPGYMCMIFGGLYGGLSFYGGQWIQKQKLDEIWFQSLRCGINEVQIFRYGAQGEVPKALIADNSQNIIVLDLKPKRAEKICDFHIGSIVNSIKKRGQIPYIASEDGCIRMLCPIKLRDTQISFLDFQQQICKFIPLLAGFNNRDSRLLNQRQRTYKITSQGNIVDGELIRSFLSLTDALKNNIYDNSEMSYQQVKGQLLGQI